MCVAGGRRVGCIGLVARTRKDRSLSETVRFSQRMSEGSGAGSTRIGVSVCSLAPVKGSSEFHMKRRDLGWK